MNFSEIKKAIMAANEVGLYYQLDEPDDWVMALAKGKI